MDTTIIYVIETTTKTGIYTDKYLICSNQEEAIKTARAIVNNQELNKTEVTVNKVYVHETHSAFEELAKLKNEITTNEQLLQQQQVKQIRKKRAANGNREQKMTAFRLDNDNTLWLESQPNRGRYINNLIREDRKRQP